MTKLNSDVTKLIGVGVAVGVTVWVITRGLGQAADSIVEGAKATGNFVNPASTGNFISRGINAVGDVLDDGSDDDSFSLGGFIFDLTHRDELDG